MNGIPLETPSNKASDLAAKPKNPRKPRVAAHKAHVAPSKARSAKKATLAKRAAKDAKSARSPKKSPAARHGSKSAKVLDLLQRSGGATVKELMKTTGWLAHSVRGFLSGALGRKMGLTVTSIKAEDGQRRYSIKG